MTRFDHAHGSILIVALVLMLIMATLITRVTRQNFIHTRQAHLFKNREQAKFLALGGVTIAISQLNAEEHATPQQTNEGEKEQNSIERTYTFLLPILNRWQEFTLNEQADGIDGTIQFCIGSEDGKINLNTAFDFEKNEFRAAYASLFPSSLTLDQIKDEERLKEGKDLAHVLTLFLKQRGKKLDDISELTQIAPFQLFYQPPKPKQKERLPLDHNTLCLYDLFTLWGSEKGINPLLLSDATRAVLGFQRVTDQSSARQQSLVKEILTKLSLNSSMVWNEEKFKILAPLYQGESSPAEVISEKFSPLNKIITRTIEPQTISVLSYGSVGNSSQRVLAIVKKSEKPKQAKKSADRNNRENTTEEDGTPSFFVPNGYEIMRIFWI
jgi:hypothetical protein